MNITLDTTDAQQRIFRASAAASGTSLEEYILEAALQRAEDEQDYRIAEAAYFEWLANPDDVIDHEDLAAEVGLR